MPDIKETSKAKLDMKGPTRPHDKVTYARNAYLSPHHGRLADKPPNIEIYPFKQTRKFPRFCQQKRYTPSEKSRGGWARSANFVPHQHFSDSARVLQHGLNTVNLHRYHLSSVGSFHQHHSFHQTGKPTFSLDSINRDRFRTTP